MPDPKRIAAVVTVYRRHSHADVILGKILEGYHHDRQAFPNLQLVSMFVDQFPKDMKRLGRLIRRTVTRGSAPPQGAGP